jgi:hypothetical protein
MLDIKGYDILNQDNNMEISLPNVGELLIHPFFFNMPLEDAIIIMSPKQKELFAQFPNSNRRKHRLATYWIRMVNKHVSSYIDGYVSYQNRWHVPKYSSFIEEDQDIYYHVTNDSSSTLEINGNDLSLDYAIAESANKVQDFNFWFLKEQRKLEISPIRLVPNKINIYEGNSLIRNIDASRIEFRVDIRIIETNNIKRLGLPMFETALYDYKRMRNRDSIIKKPTNAIDIKLPDIYLTDLYVPRGT